MSDGGHQPGPAALAGTGATGRLVSVNVGAPRPVTWRDRVVLTSIFKCAVEGRVAVRGVNLAGDDQADRKVHGGPDRAVYAYAREEIDWWAGEVGRALAPGDFGENLTTAGLPVSSAVIGERWRIGEVELEVCGPRVPCFKLGIRMGDDGFPRRFAAAGRPGTYLRIRRNGSVAAEDEVAVEHRPAHGVTVGAVAHAYHHDRSGADGLLAAPELAQGWQDWARNVIVHRR